MITWHAINLSHLVLRTALFQLKGRSLSSPAWISESIQSNWKAIITLHSFSLLQEERKDRNFAKKDCFPISLKLL